MKNILLLVFIFSPVKYLWAQNCSLLKTFQISYGTSGDDRFYNINRTNDQQLICVGATNSMGAGDYDGWVVKTDTFGNVLWGTAIGNVLRDYFYGVQPLKDGGYAISGYSSNNNYPDGEAWLVKTDVNGNVIWSRGLGIDNTVFWAVCETNDNGIIAVGNIKTAGAGSESFVVKFDENGNLMWGKGFTSGDSNQAYNVIQTQDGNIVVCGLVFGVGAGDHDGWIMKLNNSDGTVMWLNTYGGPGSDELAYIAEDPTGDLISCGNWNTGNSWLISCDSNGNLNWSKIFSNPTESLRSNYLRVLNDGYIYSVLDLNSTYEAIIKTDQNGNLDWNRQYISNDDITNQTAASVYPSLSQQNYFVSCYSNLNGSNDGILIKTDSLGHTGGCQESTPNLNTTVVVPSVQPHSFNIIDIAKIDTVSVTEMPDNINTKVFCPQTCCHDTTVKADTAICSGAIYTLPNGDTTSVSGIYQDTLQSAMGCDSIIVTNLTVNPSPSVFLGNDTSICQGDNIILDAGNPGAAYLWQDSTATEVYDVNQGGTYYVAVHNINGCTASDTITITQNYLPSVQLNPDSLTLCPGETKLLTAIGTNSDNYLWDDGSTNPEREVSASQHWYKVTVQNVCGTAADSVYVSNGICFLYMPNAFTPNNDGQNDYFKPVFEEPVNDYKLEVFNRWGALVFMSSSPNTSWDGSCHNQPCPTGGYVWMMQFKDANTGKQYFLKGSLTLIR